MEKQSEINQCYHNMADFMGASLWHDLKWPLCNGRGHSFYYQSIPCLQLCNVTDRRTQYCSL